ncbi:MAG: corrinoid protein [Deltaproteobacteria bacterium]|nr:corrinoid protein [Deltaproteobacteria bacterium]
MATISDLGKYVEAGALAEVERVVNELLNEGTAPEKIIEDGIVPTLDVVGKKFSKGECFIPEMLIAAKASQKAIDILRPMLVDRGVYKPKARIVIGTVMGDLHDIGKNIVSMVLESAGFEVKDLGVDVSPETFIDTIKELNPDIVALSCLITTTMTNMRVTIEKIKEANLRDSVKIIIGGPPINEDFASEIGADLYGENAYTGLEKLRALI